MTPTRTLPCLALLLAGCFGPDSDGSTDAGASTDAEVLGDWKLTHACRGDDPRDPIDVMSVRVEGDSLIVQIGHGGGCAAHEYGLCFDEVWLEETPVQVPLSVLHDGHGDTCEAYLTSEVTFDLRPIADEYGERYHASAGTVMLLLDGQHEYTFQDEAFADLEGRIDAANHCESLDECVGVHIPPCETRYVSSMEDVEGLQADIDAWAEDAGVQDPGCPAVCACGLLRCTEGRCETSDSDCMEAPADARMVCL